MAHGIEQLRQMVENAPSDTTHVCLENGTHHQFKIKGLDAEIHTGEKWLAYDGCALPDLESVSLLSDIKLMVKMCGMLDSVTTSVSKTNTVHAFSCIAIDEFLEKEFNFFTQKSEINV